MKIEAKYQEGLKKLIKDTDLDEINVVNLCNAVKSNRQTFYYHFRDISDVVESILLKEKTMILKPQDTFLGVTKNLLTYINSHYSFLAAINKSYCSDKIVSFFYSYYYTTMSEILKSTKKSMQTSNILRYLCNLYSSELSYWLSSKRKEKPESLTHRFVVIWNYFTEQYHADLRKV